MELKKNCKNCCYFPCLNTKFENDNHVCPKHTFEHEKILEKTVEKWGEELWK